jgi:catechol 2,3-dioxygenase-like lactoylglutathione lyase family enzyme
MRSEPFRVQRLDHVHVLVTDRPAAIAWYARVFGLEKVYDDTVHGDTRGPITLSSDDGATHLALFERDKIPPSQTVAFRVDGAGFTRFLDRLAELDLRDSRGARVTAGDTWDHGHSYSIYFCDPDGNPYEITSYDHAFVRDRLAATARTPCHCPPR